MEALEQRVVLAAVAVTVDSGTGTLILESTAGAGNEAVVVKAGATFTDVLVGGQLATRIESLNSSNITAISFDGKGSTGSGDSLSVTGVTTAAGLTVTLTDVERLQLNSATNTTVSSATAADVPFTLVTSTISGTLNLTHDGNIVQSGKLIVSGATTVTAVSGSTDKDITLTNSANAFGVLDLNGAAISVKESSPTVLSGTAASGALTVTSTGSITTSGTNTVTGSGAISLTSNGGSIDVSGAFTSSGTVSLKGTSVTFTDTSATSVDLKTVTATSNLNVTAEAGAIEHTSGNINVGGLATFVTGTSAGTRADITLTAGSNNFGSFAATGRTIMLTEKSSTDLGAVNAVTNGGGGNLTITSSGALTDSGVVNVDGTTNLTAKNSAIALDSATNEFAGTITFSGTNVALTDNDSATSLAASTAKGNLTVITTGGATTGVSQTGALNVSGRLTVTATGKDINLSTNGGTNKFGSISVFGRDVTLNESDATDLFTSTVTEDFVLTTSGAVTDSGNLDVDATTSITAGAGKSITLDGTASTFDGQINLSSSTGAGTLINTVASILGNVTLKTINLNSSAAVSQADSTTITVTGLLAVDATGSTIDVGTQTGTTANFGAVSLHGTTVNIAEDSATNLAESTITGDFFLDSTGAVTDSGDLVVTGTTDIDATTANDITLDSSGSSFGATGTTTDLVLNGNDISVLDNSDATKLGAVTATTGTLTVIANGPITDTGTITVTGGNLATFNANGENITLDSSTSQYTGAISLIGKDAVLSTGADAKASGDAAVDLGTTNVETLSVTTTNGDLTDSGAVKVGGTTTLVTGTADITLDSSFNSFGELVLTSDEVTINERGNTELGASTVSSLEVTSTGGIEDNGTDFLDVTGATTLTANGGAISLTSDNQLGGTVNLTATSDISVRNTVDTELGDVSTPLDFTLTTTTDAVTQTGDAIVGDLATITATGANITLGGSNQFGRLAFSGEVVTINETSADGTVLEASTAGTSLTITSAGNITDNGTITAAGTTDLTAGATGTENITLDEAGNSFEELVLAGDVVTILNTNAGGTDLGTSTIGTSLTLTSADGVNQTGNVSVGSALTITAGAGAGDVDLNNNNFNIGSISVTANNVTIDEDSADGLILGQSVVNGNLVVTAAGEVTDSGMLDVDGTTSITTSGDNIILDHTNAGGAPDSIFGDGDPSDSVTLTGANITLASGSDLILGNISATGNLSISADGDITNVLTIETGTTDGTYGDIDVTGTTTIDATLGANDHTINLDLDNSVSSFGTAPVITASNVDTTAPTLTITTASTTVASGTVITVTFTFNSAVTGFVAGDIVIGGTGTFTSTGGFSGTGTTYTLVGTVAAAGQTVTFDVAANKAQETSSGIGNLVATQLMVSIT